MIRWLIVPTIALFVLSVIAILGGRAIIQSAPRNVFVRQLAHDSRLVDAQWTWREIQPGRYTLEEAERVLRRVNEDGFTKQMTVIEYDGRIDWVKFGSPMWTGSLVGSGGADSSFYMVMLRLPEGQVTLADVLSIYGAPFIRRSSYLDRSELCFSGGLCVTTQYGEKAPRMQPDDEVLSISYMTPSLIYSSMTDDKWQGFRRY